MSIADFGGGVRARLMEREAQRQALEQAAFQRQQQMEQGRRAEEQLGLQRQRFQSEQTAAAQQAEAAKAEQEQRKLFLGALPPAMRQAIEARSYGLTNVTPHDFEDEQTHGGHIKAERDQKIADLEAEEGVKAKYRPKPQTSRTWVIRNGQPVRVSEDEIQPGDRPYSANAGQSDEGGQSAYGAERTTRTRDAVDNLLGKVGAWTVGVGSAIKDIPILGRGSSAKDFEADLNFLKSNIAFNELAEMRAASKTGGALGAVSDRELTLLSSALGALDQEQSPENLRVNLNRIRESLDRWEQAKQGGRAAQTPPGAPQKGRSVGRFEIIEEP